MRVMRAHFFSQASLRIHICYYSPDFFSKLQLLKSNCPQLHWMPETHILTQS